MRIRPRMRIRTRRQTLIRIKDKGSDEDGQKADKDKGSDEKNVDKDKGEGMSATEVKDDTNVAKTGEVDIVPIIIALAVIAGGAGAAYVLYKKKK